MRIQEFGTDPKRPAREGSRPARGHEPVARYKEQGVAEGTLEESILSPDKRRQVIHFLAKKMDWEVNYLELATDHELIKWYKAVQRGEKPMESSDLQLDQAKRYAQQHYQALDPEKAFQKFVQRSLMHSKEEDEAQDERLDKIEKQLARLSVSESLEELESQLVQERGKAPRSLCTGSTPDEDLGASQLASCKSQGLRARDGEKSHLIGHRGSKVRVKVGGKKIKGKKYGGPLPDYGTRKGQK